MTDCNNSSLVYSHQAKKRVTTVEQTLVKSRKELKLTKEKVEKIICSLKDALIEEGRLQSKIRGLDSCLGANVKTVHELERKQYEEDRRRNKVDEMGVEEKKK